MVSNHYYSLLLQLSVFVSLLTHGFGELSWEENRQLEFEKRGYKWPIERYLPNTKGWKELHERRLRQVAEIEDDSDRYEGYAQTVSSGIVQPNFTEFGFGLVRAPEDLMAALRQGIQDGIAAGPRVEHDIRIIEGEEPPWFIDRPDLTARVLNELVHYPEQWAGMELTPVIAYGFRLYRNNSMLNMHLDRSNTHIISFILHIDSSDDAEPWPIAIEDFNGNTHEVILTSGDMLLYESSKCLHGRPRVFQGSWYTSVFVHYHPKYNWKGGPYDRNDRKIYAIPKHWKTKPTSANEPPLKMEGTGMKEPTCLNNWCNNENAIKWSGPGQEGFLLAPNGEKYPFEAKKLPCVDLNEKCSWWATWESDECKTNIPYMGKNCRKSCGACTLDSDENTNEKHGEL